MSIGHFVFALVCTQAFQAKRRAMSKLLDQLSSCFTKKAAESGFNCVVVGRWAWDNGAKSGFPFRRLLRLLAKKFLVFVVDEHKFVTRP